MYLFVVKQFLFAFKSFKYSELGYCQTRAHKATQNHDWSPNLHFDFIRTALLGVSVTTETQIHLMHAITTLQVHLEGLLKIYVTWKTLCISSQPLSKDIQYIKYCRFLFSALHSQSHFCNKTLTPPRHSPTWERTRTLTKQPSMMVSLIFMINLCSAEGNFPLLSIL